MVSINIVSGYLDPLFTLFLHKIISFFFKQAKFYHINSPKHKQKRDLFLQLLFPIRLVSL